MNRSVIDGCLRVAAGSLQLRTVELLLAQFPGAVNGAEEVGEILVFHMYMYMRMYNYRFMTRTFMFRAYYQGSGFTALMEACMTDYGLPDFRRQQASRWHCPFRRRSADDETQEVCYCTAMRVACVSPCNTTCDLHVPVLRTALLRGISCGMMAGCALGHGAIPLRARRRCARANVGECMRASPY